MLIMKLNDIFKDYCNNINLRKYVYIGYSGGVDSGVLLDLSCKVLRREYFLKVIHINHSYSDQANRWSLFCRNICNTYDIVLYTYTIKNKMYIDNIEETLRVFRFNFFLKSIVKNTTLLLAHHNDDLLETIIMRLFRGGGINAVSGMKYRNKINCINIFRPLLNFCKLDIVNYALFNNIPFITDNSNFDVKFKRNHIRLYFDMFLKEYTVNKQLILKHIKLTDNIVRYVTKFLSFFIKSAGFQYKAISVIYMNTMSFFLFKELIRCWLNFNEYKMPSYNSLHELIKLIRSRSFKHSYIKIDKCIIEKLDKNIYVSEYYSEILATVDILAVVYVNVFNSNMVVVYIKHKTKFILKNFICH